MSVNLQKPSIDLCTAIESVELVQSVISEIRSNVINEFKELFNSASSIASGLDITKLMPRIVSILDRILDAIKFYKYDFRDNYNPSIMESEWRLWVSKWKLFFSNS